MGNCVFRGFGVEVQEMIKVATPNGGIMELYPPVTAESITNEFPGHAIFRSRTPPPPPPPPPHHHHDLFSHHPHPLLHSDELLAGEFYYLLPHNNNGNPAAGTVSTTETNLITPYRMSFDNQRLVRIRSSYPAEVLFPRYSSSSSTTTATGVWKVNLVISPEQLSEILLQDSRTEALIHSVRTVAKCANNINGPPSLLPNSDQCSVATS